LVPEVGLTPAFEVLAKPSSIQNTVTSETPPPVAFEVAMSSLCSFYRQRVNLRELASSVPSRFLNREITLAKVAQKYGTANPLLNQRPPGNASLSGLETRGPRPSPETPGSAGILPAP